MTEKQRAREEERLDRLEQRLIDQQYMPEFAKEIKELRLKAKISRSELAKRFRKSDSWIQSIENAQTVLKFDMRDALRQELEDIIRGRKPRYDEVQWKKFVEWFREQKAAGKWPPSPDQLTDEYQSRRKRAQ